MRRIGYTRPNLYIPFFNKTVPMPEWLYFVFAAFIIVGTVNAVNITDGVDGLASGTSVPVCLFFVCVTVAWGEEFLELGIFASGLAGGLVGFLMYNFNPAKVFMGDTGSLFLGGAIAAMAFAYDMPLILITLGIMYIIETLSDIIQVATSSSATASAYSRWRLSTIILRWADGRAKSGARKNYFCCLQAYL